MFGLTVESCFLFVTGGLQPGDFLLVGTHSFDEPPDPPTALVVGQIQPSDKLIQLANVRRFGIW